MQVQNWRKIIGMTTVTLCCLTVWSGCMVSRLLARYTTSDTGGDQARVAGFHMNITAAGNTLPLGIGLGDTTGDATSKQVDFTVSGNSEVALEYELQVELTHADGKALTQEEWNHITAKIAPVTAGGPGTGVSGVQSPGKTGASRIYTFSGVSGSGSAKEQVAPTDNYSKDYRLTFDTDLTGTAFTDGFRVEIYINGQQVD